MSLQTAPEWFTVAGLAIDIVAVVPLAWELLLKKAAPQGSLHRGLSGCPTLLKFSGGGGTIFFVPKTRFARAFRSVVPPCPTVPSPRVWDSGTRGGELPI